MSGLTGPAVEAALRSMAADLASRKEVRRIWVFLLPGLTAEIFTEAAKEAGVPILPGKDLLTWHDVAIATGQQWAAIRDICARRLGVDPAQLVQPDISSRPYYRAWQADLAAYQRRHGIDPGTGRAGGSR